jgi:hypothetical protein
LECPVVVGPTTEEISSLHSKWVDAAMPHVWRIREVPVSKWDASTVVVVLIIAHWAHPLGLTRLPYVFRIDLATNFSTLKCLSMDFDGTKFVQKSSFKTMG